MFSHYLSHPVRPLIIPPSPTQQERPTRIPFKIARCQRQTETLTWPQWLNRYHLALVEPWIISLPFYSRISLVQIICIVIVVVEIQTYLSVRMLKPGRYRSRLIELVNVDGNDSVIVTHGFTDRERCSKGEKNARWLAARRPDRNCDRAESRSATTQRSMPSRDTSGTSRINHSFSLESTNDFELFCFKQNSRFNSQQFEFWISNLLQNLLGQSILSLESLNCFNIRIIKMVKMAIWIFLLDIL